LASVEHDGKQQEGSYAQRLFSQSDLSPIGSEANLNLSGRVPVAGSDNLAKQRAGSAGLYVPPKRPIKHVQKLGSELDAHRFNWPEVLL
jgi:hypothetical protein